MELSYNEELQQRAKIGCNVCLASDMWTSRSCPLRSSDITSAASVAPLISTSDRCPVDGAYKSQNAYSEILITVDTGVFPYGGGTLEQPHAFVEAFNHVRSMKNAAEAERFDRARNK